MTEKGYAYIPKNCKTKKCPAHVAFHGCQQSIENIETKFIEFAGYNHVAEANDIIILYPQIRKTTENPNWCWDYYGYTSKTDYDYATLFGVQGNATFQFL